MAVETPAAEFGWKAPDFTLQATDGKRHSLSDIAGPKGTVIAFICNHCPYVHATVDRMVEDFAQLAELGVGAAAICSNDAVNYPQDSFENMVEFAKSHNFGFPYLHDADQSVAHAYGAVCTPDFFGFDGDLALRYRGRLDSTRPKSDTPPDRRELLGAMRQIVETGTAPSEQLPSMGCSIKWKAA